MKSRPNRRLTALSLISPALVVVGCAVPATKTVELQPTVRSTDKQAAPAQPQAQDKPEAAQASAQKALPPANYVGKITLSPKNGPAGTLVTVTGTGLPASATLDMAWNTVKGSWLLKGAAKEEFHGRSFEPATMPMGKVTTDANGGLQAQFKAPDDYGFLHDVTLMQDGVIRNKANFMLEMQAAFSPNSGPVGTPITISIKSMGWGNLENSWMVIYDNNFTGWLSAVTTGGKAEAVILATGQPGKHIIQIIHGAFTVPYLNGQQSPSPDRPTWTYEFTVTDGEAVLPPAPEKQGIAPKQAASVAAGSGPAVTVNPVSGPVGTPLQISVGGMKPGDQMKFFWSTVEGNRVSGNGWQELSKQIGSATVGPDGTASLLLPAPDDLGGVHTITVGEKEKALAQTTFTMQPSAFALSRTSGPAGTLFNLHLKGVGWTETANIYMINYDNSYLGYVCGFNSQGDVVVPMKASGQPGWHYIDLYPGVYKGKDVPGTQDFRIPQLTYAADHPGEQLPAFRFAFLVTD